MHPSTSTRPRHSPAAVLAFLAALLGACPAAFGCELRVESAWIRAPAPAQTELAAYAVLANSGSHPVRITRISTPAAGMAMLHETRNMGGMSRMNMLDSLLIPGGGRVQLAPGGKHLMLSDLRQPVKAGDRVQIDFQDDAGCITSADFPVRPLSTTD